MDREVCSSARRRPRFGRVLEGCERCVPPRKGCRDASIILRVLSALTVRVAVPFVLGVALVLAIFPVFGEGATGGGRIELKNETFTCSKYPQPVDFDLVKVTIEPGRRARTDGFHTSNRGGECTGRIGRLEIDTWTADGIKVHQPAHDLVIEGGYVRCHAREGDVHQDGIQAMGGERVTFKNLEVDCTTASNGAMFINQGAGRNGRPTDIVCDGCILKKGPTRNRVLRISDSLRSGARNSTIVWCGTGPECGEGPPIMIIDAATDPVNENNRIVLHSEGAAPPPEPQPPALRLTRFALSSTTPKAGGRLSALLTVAGMPQGEPKPVVTCTGAVGGKPVRVLGKSSAGPDTRCALAVPVTAKGKLLTGLVGVTSRGTTLNRSFTLRVASSSQQRASGGRVTATLTPSPSGVSLQRFVLSDQRPAAGKRVFATISLAGLSASGGGTVKCSGVAGGKALRVLGSSLKAANASCGWLVAASAARKPVMVSLTVTRGGVQFTHSFHVTVRA